jgi:hypothetical protein
MKKFKPYNSSYIAKNLESVYKSGDITKLSKASYNFLYLMSGFIAHYNLYGFQDHYQDLRDLSQDILNSMDINDPEREIRDPWFAGQYGVEYCQSKVDTLKAIKEVVLKYKDQAQVEFDQKEKDQEIAIAKSIATKYGMSFE